MRRMLQTIIGQANPRGGTDDAHSADKQSCLRFLISTDMLDTRSDDGLADIGPLDMTGHRPEIRLYAVNFRDETLLFHERCIGF